MDVFARQKRGRNEACRWIKQLTRDSPFTKIDRWHILNMPKVDDGGEYTLDLVAAYKLHVAGES